MFIPGWLIALITFPGVVTHEIAHRFFCDLAKVPVYEVRYFGFGDPPAYVIHGPVKELKKAFLISIGPLIINTILCMLLTFTAALSIFVLKETNYGFAFALLIWIGISIGMHAFPSNADAESFVQQVKEAKRNGFLLVISKIFAVLIKIANALRFIWFDAIYAFVVSMILPSLFVFVL